MTTPEQITVSLDMAKKLKEAGWSQDWEEGGQWYWRYGKLISIHDEDAGLELSYVEGMDKECPFAAPTAGEIIKNIPVEMRSDVPLERLDDPDAWAEIYCALQQRNIH